MNIVLDTNILISATLWDGSLAQKILFKLIEQDVKIYISKEIILEYENVLLRDFNYSKKDIEPIVKTILKFAILIIPIKKVDVVKEDETDNRILECALESKSDYILTYDKHLLKLIKYNNIKIIKPENFKEIIFNHQHL